MSLLADHGSVQQGAPEWAAYRNEEGKYSLRYPADLALESDGAQTGFVTKDTGFGEFRVVAEPTDAADTRSWLASAVGKPEETAALFEVKNSAGQAMTVIARPERVDEDNGTPVYATQVRAVEVLDGVLYQVSWPNQAAVDALPTIGSRAVRFLEQFSIDVPAASADDREWHDANASLAQFLGLLHEGTYAAAAQLYAGDMDQLRYWNPKVDPQDAAALWKNGCELNGLLCFEVAEIVPVRANDDGSRTFRVTYVAPPGTDFTGSQDDVTFTVRKSPDGIYLVETLPPYSP